MHAAFLLPLRDSKKSYTERHNSGILIYSRIFMERRNDIMHLPTIVLAVLGCLATAVPMAKPLALVGSRTSSFAT